MGFTARGSSLLLRFSGLRAGIGSNSTALSGRGGLTTGHRELQTRDHLSDSKSLTHPTGEWSPVHDSKTSSSGPKFRPHSDGNAVLKRPLQK